jgi:hypothetical protein
VVRVDDWRAEVDRLLEIGARHNIERNRACEATREIVDNADIADQAKVRLGGIEKRLDHGTPNNARSEEERFTACF